MNKERFYLFDNLKGLMIFFVVFGHLLAFCPEEEFIVKNLYFWIYSFHMPVFVFTTGYFGKYNKTKIKNSLLYPYIIFSIFYYVFKILVLNKTGITIFTVPYHHLWYLPSSICWYLTIPFIEKNINKKNLLMICSIIFMLLAGYIPLFGRFLSLSRTICFYPFFLLGYMCKKIDKSKFLQIIQNKKFKITMIVLFTVVSIIFFSGSLDFLKRSMLYYTSNYKSMDSNIFHRLQILCFNFIGIGFFVSCVPNKRLSCITHFGQNTIYIFLLHDFITGWIGKTHILKNIQFPITISFVLAILITVITVLPIVKKTTTPFIIYKNNKKQET